MAKVKNKAPHTCSICLKAYQRKGSLNRHLQKHTGVKPYKCENCGQSFTLKDFLKAHMLTHYNEKLLAHTEKRKVSKVSGRRKIYVSSDNSDKTKPKKSVKKFPCSRCNISFSRKDNLQVHMSTHIKTMLYKCANGCSFESDTEETMKKHVATHPEFQAYTVQEVTYKHFKCTKCPARFCRKSGLLTHSRVHEDVKRFACKLCDYQSSWVNRMKFHALTHLNE